MKVSKLISCCAVFVLAFWTSNTTAQQLKISYTGNMGVLVEGEDQSILIDGLHEKYKPAYQYTPLVLASRIISPEEVPLVDFLLITHFHRDHFSANLSQKFLQENTNSVLLGPVQAKEQIESIDSADNVSNRIFSFNAFEGEVTLFEKPDVTIKVIPIPHANQRRHSEVENLGYVVSLGDKNILHVGDAGSNIDVLQKLDFIRHEIDVVVLPYWLLSSDNITEIKKLIKAKRYVATHINPSSEVEFVQSGDNDIEYFTSVGQHFFF